MIQATRSCVLSRTILFHIFDVQYPRLNGTTNFICRIIPSCFRLLQSIIFDLRMSDLISDAEEGNLRFHSFHFLHRHGLKPHVLPVCFFAGKIQRALDEGSTDGMSTSVLQQAYQLFLALLTEVGVLREGEQQKLHKLQLVNVPQNFYHNTVRNYYACLNILQLLMHAFYNTRQFGYNFTLT